MTTPHRKEKDVDLEILVPHPDSRLRLQIYPGSACVRKPGDDRVHFEGNLYGYSNYNGKPSTAADIMAMAASRCRYNEATCAKTPYAEKDWIRVGTLSVVGEKNDASYIHERRADLRAWNDQKPDPAKDRDDYLSHFNTSMRVYVMRRDEKTNLVSHLKSLANKPELNVAYLLNEASSTERRIFADECRLFDAPDDESAWILRAETACHVSAAMVRWIVTGSICWIKVGLDEDTTTSSTVCQYDWGGGDHWFTVVQEESKCQYVMHSWWKRHPMILFDDMVVVVKRDDRHERVKRIVQAVTGVTAFNNDVLVRYAPAPNCDMFGFCSSSVKNRLGSLERHAVKEKADKTFTEVVRTWMKDAGGEHHRETKRARVDTATVVVK